MVVLSSRVDHTSLHWRVVGWGKVLIFMDTLNQQGPVKKTPEQLAVLENGFQKCAYPPDEMRQAMVEETGLSEYQIRTWFNHRRKKEKNNQIRAMIQDGDVDDRGNGVDFDDGEFDVTMLDEQDKNAYNEMQQIIQVAKGRLESPYREDGPPLALYFDDPPSKQARLEASVDVKTASRKMLTAMQELDRLEASIRKEQERLSREKERSNLKMERQRVKELQRLENEKRKQLERAMREQKKEEERLRKIEEKQRQMQEREEKRLQSMKEKELLKEERNRIREQKKKEKEMMKALMKQEKEALRTRATYLNQKDDLEIEWDTIVAAYKAKHNISADVELVEGQVEGLVRPPFPPEHVKLMDLCGIESGQSFAGSVIASWSFLSHFADLMAIDKPSLDTLVEFICHGQANEELTRIHIGLLRLIQVDAEESRAMSSATTAAKPEAGENISYFTNASLLEEAWAWGFDVDTWRAHLNSVTWVEVCRQICISAGLGRKRPISKKKKAIRGAGKPGDDLVVSAETGKLELKLPARLAESSVKGACWLVLKDAGYEGLRVEEIAKRIQKMGLRDLRTSRTPETSVAGAMGRDVLFERISPATYALHSLRTRYNELVGNSKAREKLSDSEDDKSPTDAGEASKGDADSCKDESADDVHGEEVEEEDEEEEEEDEEEEEEEETVHKTSEGEIWLEKLKEGSYNSLSLPERASLLSCLCQLSLDSMTARLTIYQRLEEQRRIKKCKIDEDKLEQNLIRLRKRVDLANKARQDALNSQINLESMLSKQENRPFDQSRIKLLESSEMEKELEQEILAAEEALKVSWTGPFDISSEGLRKRGVDRAENALKDLQMNSVRYEPLGSDRQYNKYWRFVAPGVDSDDGKNRLYVETVTGEMKFIATKESFDLLLGSLNERGPREKELKTSLLGIQNDIVKDMPTEPWKIEENCKEYSLPESSLKLVPFASNVIASENIAIPGGHQLDASINIIRESITKICAALEEQQVKSTFDKNAFMQRLEKSMSLQEMKHLMGELEAHIEKNHIHSGFSVDPLLVKGAWISTGNEVATAMPGSTIADVMLSPGANMIGSKTSETVTDSSSLSWLPETLASISLRLMSLDAAIFYRNDSCGRETMPEYTASLRPCKLTDANNGLVESMYVRDNGHMDPSLFACFPYRLLHTPRIDFSFPKEQFESDVKAGSDAQVSYAVKTIVQTLGTSRGRGRGRRGGRGGRPSLARAQGRKSTDEKSIHDIEMMSVAGPTPEASSNDEDSDFM